MDRIEINDIGIQRELTGEELNNVLGGLMFTIAAKPLNVNWGTFVEAYKEWLWQKLMAGTH
jgi:hypothetical protein